LSILEHVGGDAVLQCCSAVR